MGKRTRVGGAWPSLANTRGGTRPVLPHGWGRTRRVCSQTQLPIFPSVPPDVLRFDNTYSFVHAKKVSFTVEVLLPDEGMQKYDKELTPV